MFRSALIASLVLVCAGSPAFALIDRIIPLKDVLQSEQVIAVLTVEKLDPAKPLVVFAVAETLKGKPTFERVPVNFTGSAEGQKLKHPEAMFKRLAVGQKVILFTTPKAEPFAAYAFVNGTWFQMQGVRDGTTLRWRFLQAEPNLRKTFAGTTDALRKIALDGLAKKKEPPAPNLKEPPAIGPENPPAKPGAFAPVGGPIFGVIPTFALLGPLAILSALFPAVFGGLALMMRRWLVLLSLLGLLSTIWLIAAVITRWLPDYVALVQPAPLWLFGCVLTLAGGVWASWRYRAALVAGQGESYRPRATERIGLIVLAVAALGFLVWAGLYRKPLLDPPWQELLVTCLTLAVGALALIAWNSSTTPGPSLEAAMLWAVAFGFGIIGAYEAGHLDDRNDGVVWVFKPKQAGIFFATPMQADGRVFISATHGSGFSQSGAVYAIDADTGKELWRFTAEGTMKPAFCSPNVVDGKVYVGEGFHQDVGCRVFCLDAATGKEIWNYATSSHTEGKPAVSDGRVYFSAGDHGLLCVDAETGKEIWNIAELHVDVNVAVSENRLYAGSGKGDKFNFTCVFCADAKTGKMHWKVPVPYSAFGSPTLVDMPTDPAKPDAPPEQRALFGIGNGNMLESDKSPAGQVLCCKADTGDRVWAIDLPDSVLCQPLVVGQRVYFGSRDGNAYCASLEDGRILWKARVGSPVVTPPVPAVNPLDGSCRTVYVTSSDGLVLGLDAETGHEQWSFDVPRRTRQPTAQMFATPVVQVVPLGRNELHRILVGGGVSGLSGLDQSARLFSLERDLRR